MYARAAYRATRTYELSLLRTSPAMSSSSKGRMRGWRSIMWIFVLPKLAKMVAYSQPITPAPTMTMLFGNDVNDSICYKQAEKGALFFGGEHHR
jgi:hypothetical protein